MVEGSANTLVQASSSAEGRLTLLALDAVEKLLTLMIRATDEALKESVSFPEKVFIIIISLT